MTLSLGRGRPDLAAAAKAVQRPSHRGKARVGERASVRNFYREALSQAEQVELPEAQEVEGLDQEIAVLRVRLKRALEQHPEDITLIGKGLDLLVKAVAARYRLSPKAKRELAQHLEVVFQGMSETFLASENVDQAGGNHDG